MKTERLPALWGRVNVETLAAMTGAHLTTARRWKRLTVLPLWLARFVRGIVEGHLCEISQEFAGWRIVRGQIVSPEGWEFSPGEIRALPFMRQQLAHYKAQARLPAQADFIESNWQRLPGALVSDAAPRAVARVVDLFGADAGSLAQIQDQQQPEREPREGNHQLRG